MAFPVILRLKYKGKVIGSDKDRPEGVTIRAWRVVTKSANRAMAYHWHENFLPLHFGNDAARRYGGSFKKRTNKWLMRKHSITRRDVERAMPESYWALPALARQKPYAQMLDTMVKQAGGIEYNVHTGTLREMVQTVIFRAFPSRFRLEMPVPSYIPSRRRDPSQPDIRAELTVMLPSEISKLQKVGQRVLRDMMQQDLSTGVVPAESV
jgi:hypothetical protein